MRIITILLLLLTMGVSAFATDAALARTLESLTSRQKTILYQYGTLSAWASPAQADSFWRMHQPELGRVTREEAGLLATELLNNTELVYAIKHPSRLQALRGVFTASRLLIGLAALVGAFAVIQLLGRYLPDVWRSLLRYLSPLFRWLFSPKMLTWELLVLGMAAIYGGPLLGNLEIRAVVIHTGLVLLWSQLTAICIRIPFVKYYSKVIKNIFDDDQYTPLQAFRYVGVPALITTAAVWWVMQRCADSWYAYELIVPLMIAAFALPPVRMMEGRLNRVLLPFGNKRRWRAKDERMATYIVVSLVVWVGMLLLPVVYKESLLVLTIFLGCALLGLSIEEVTNCGIPNYIWLQVVTLVFLCAVVLAGAQLEALLLMWAGLGGLLLYVLIKYWELPMVLGWSWKNKKAWGALGMAVLIWGIALLIRSRPEWFAIFPAKI
ncbi:hypothetical protein [Chitinophaga sp. Ak27]|uniref:hypothetical protein n=1 Tax=Chitinophaga sp. Ak27 TaxID=2726116 RepID=UPI00145F1049|nr:hypothetical protein [Chitinophaga sp. Ak27]NLU95545.1 hypothetical protein [Chitinophaga sp. Ak27]